MVYGIRDFSLNDCVVHSYPQVYSSQQAKPIAAISNDRDHSSYTLPALHSARRSIRISSFAGGIFAGASSSFGALYFLCRKRKTSILSARSVMRTTQKSFSLRIYLLMVIAISWPFQIAYALWAEPPFMRYALSSLPMVMVTVATYIAGRYVFIDWELLSV